MAVSSYKLRQSARDDIKEIARYTALEHGKAQRDKYLFGLSRAIESLVQIPNKGKSRHDIKEGYHSYNYQMHVIFYRVHTHYIEVLAVLHKRMLPENHLPT